MLRCIGWVRVSDDSALADHATASHQQAVLRALLWFAALSSLVFAVVNLRLGDAWLALAELGLGVYAGALLYRGDHIASLRARSLVFVVPFFVVMMYALASPYTGKVVFIWVLLVPILSHLLLGRWQGMLVALVFMISSGVIFVFKFDLQPGMPGLAVLANIVLCTVAIFGFSYVYEVSRERTETDLRHLALTDPLTRLPNRARFREVFASERQRYLRQNIPLSLLVIDIDHFKHVNDEYGHDAGDMALIFIGEYLQNRTRRIDLAARLGGEEFGVLLSGADAAYAHEVAEALRALIAARPFQYRLERIALTVSIGVAELGIDGMDFRSVFASADQRLYAAKARGRNQVVG